MQKDRPRKIALFLQSLTKDQGMVGMKNRLLVGIATGILMVGLAVNAEAILITSEPIQTTVSSTDDLWAYSYSDNGLYSSTSYLNSATQYSSAAFQGYVTGAFHPNYPGVSDWFGIAQNQSDYTTIQVFETFFQSSVDQNLTFGFGGDDGHSLFLDDAFLDGGGFGVNVSTTISVLANTQYKLTFVGNNYTGPWSFGINTNGVSLKNVQNISMNATGDFEPMNPVPEPATMLLFGTGLVGLAGYRGRKKKK